jgi:hypothetical protein
LRFDFFVFSTVFFLPIPSALCELLKVCRTSKHFLLYGNGFRVSINMLNYTFYVSANMKKV